MVEPSELASLREAYRTGTLLAFQAGRTPDRPALVSGLGSTCFAELNGTANQAARGFRAAGLRPGDVVALLCRNRPEFVVVSQACMRAGIDVMTLSWELEDGELLRLMECASPRALVADARFRSSAELLARRDASLELCLAIGGGIAGFDGFESWLEPHARTELPDPCPGHSLSCTAGTTAPPKLVEQPEFRQWMEHTARHIGSDGPRLRDDARLDSWRTVVSRLVQPSPSYEGDEVFLLPAPLHHPSSLRMALLPALHNGATCVLMDGWDSEEFLRLVEHYRVSDVFVPPILLHRLLRLPSDVREKYDVSSLRRVLHGNAPMPLHLKQAALDWLGPIVHEYYSAAEGSFTLATAQQWLERPGTVGLARAPGSIEIRDDRGDRVGPDVIGTVYVRVAPHTRIRYRGDPEATRAAHRDGYMTLGDMGYLDRDGYLFLSGRTSDIVIAGGLNVSPAEVDGALWAHPAVADAATVAVPSAERGEEVRAVIEPMPGVEPTEQLAKELLEFCRTRLAGYKCPRSIDFASKLPRSDTGKLFRRRIRDRYWHH